MKIKILALVMTACACLLQGRELFPEKAFYLGFNFTQTKALPKIAALAERAQKAGYNTVYLADAKFGNPWQRGKQYEKNLQEAVKILRAHKLKVVVYVCAHGQFLEEVPFEVESTPAQKQEYKVVNGKIRGINFFTNSSFEEGFKDWRPDRNKNITIDSTVSASGKNSVHFHLDFKRPGQIRLQRTLPVGAFKHYRLSLKLKTRNLKGGGSTFGLAALPVGVMKKGKSGDGFRYFCFQKLNAACPIKSTQDWQEYTFTFNTLDQEKVTLFIGCWGAVSGDFWIDDIELHSDTFTNIVRRSDTPLSVTSADGKVRYTEGKDFSVVQDPLCGHYRWKGRFDFTHPAPVITIPAGSRIKEGEKIIASYHHAFAGASQTPDICLNSPVVKQLVAQQIKWFKKTVDPEGYLIAIDEYRCYGYDPACVKSKRSAGQALNDLALFTYNEIKKHAPGSRIYMWNDMFDPAGNCKESGYYYAVRGDGALWNSWIGLPKDIIILRWQSKNLKSVQASMKHWNSLGMKYVQFPTYFTDTFSPLTRPIIELSAKDPYCIGIAFAQWGRINNFKPYFEKMLDVTRDVIKSAASKK